MVRRAIAVVAAIALGATALLPSALICHCVFSGARMSAACCDAKAGAEPVASQPAISISCCLTEEAPALEARTSPPAPPLHGAPTPDFVILLPRAAVAGAAVAASAHPIVARASPDAHRQLRFGSILRI